ncbi:MAG: hypothetical protein ABI620_03895 [Chloroflexota bacterium]
MTAFDRFDPFERRITDAIDEIAAERPPTYLTDILRQTARVSQRPRWTFPERWLPVDTTLPRAGFARVPIRPLLLMTLLAAALAAVLGLYLGSQNRVAPPFGLAANGLIAYPANGDLLVREALTGEPRLFIGGDGDQSSGDFSPNGEYLTYLTSKADGYHLMFAKADGSNSHELALIPKSGNAAAAWAPDSQRVALISDVKLVPTLSILALGADSQVVPLPDLVPLDVTWSPPDGKLLLVRARLAGTEETDLYTVRPDGTELTRLNLPGHSSYGPTLTLSGSTWSPSGQSIAFNSIIDDPGSSADAYFRTSLVNPDGSNVRMLPPVQDGSLFSQAWPIYSPDGKWIVMESWYSQPDGAAINQLAIAPADGSTAARGIGPRVPGQSLVKAWSPDGTKLLLSVRDVGTLYAIDPTSGVAELLPYTGELPAWQRRAP